MKKLRLNMVLTIGLSIGAICAARITCAADLTPATASSLQRTLTELAHQARPGTLGIEVKDLKSGRTWRVNAEQAFPLMSVFKAPQG